MIPSDFSARQAARVLRKLLLIGIALLCAACAREAHPPLRIGIVAKSLGNGFFNAVRKGAEQAALEQGDTRIIFTGPTTPTAEGQIDVINALIAQHVDVIAVSANDYDALVPVLRRAQKRGVQVISFDSAVAPEGRRVHLAPSSDDLIGRACLRLAGAAMPGGKGRFAVLSATPTSTNQNAWIAAMRAALPDFPGLELVTVVYGDDLADKSYRETVALLQQYPDLRVIVAPSSVAIVAAAKAIEDQGALGRVFVTGLGLPSELEGHIAAGSVRSFAIWNPLDLGYALTRIAVQMTRDEGSVGPDRSVAVGRLGSVTFDAQGSAPLAAPFVYDRDNVAEFARIF